MAPARIVTALAVMSPSVREMVAVHWRVARAARLVFCPVWVHRAASAMPKSSLLANLTLTVFKAADVVTATVQVTFHRVPAQTEETPVAPS